MNRLKYLLKNTLLFALGSFGSRLIVFLLVPLYTAVLLPEEYGIVDLLFTVCTILGPIITLNFSEGVMRFCLDKDAKKEKILANTFIVMFFGLGTGVVLIPATYLFQVSRNYAVLLFLCSLFIGCSQIFLYYLRGIEKPLLYSIGCLIQTLLIALLNILFLVIFKWGIAGYFRAYLIANIFTSLYCIIVGKIRVISIVRIGIDKCLLKAMLQYSIAFIPNTFMWWIMNASDHVMVSAMIGAAANGLYAVSYKIPGLVSVCNTIFNQAWSYSAIKEAESTDRVEFTNTIFGRLVMFSSMVSIIILLVLKPFMRIYVSESYFNAWLYSPILLLGNYFLILGSFVGSTTYTVDKNSIGMLKSGIYGAIPNIVLNGVLIPIIGVYGAAIATCISYFIVTAYRIHDTHNSLPLNWKTKDNAVAVCAIIAATFVCYIREPFSEICTISILFLLCLYYRNTLCEMILLFKRKFGHSARKGN